MRHCQPDRVEERDGESTDPLYRAVPYIVMGMRIVGLVKLAKCQLVRWR